MAAVQIVPQSVTSSRSTPQEWIQNRLDRIASETQRAAEIIQEAIADTLVYVEGPSGLQQVSLDEVTSVRESVESAGPIRYLLPVRMWQSKEVYQE